MRSKDLRKRLMVKFHGEEGLDYGGVARSVHHAQAHSWHVTFQRQCIHKDLQTVV